jgi:glycogen operon protein
LAGDELNDVDTEGKPLFGDTVLMLFNAHHETVPFKLPSLKPNQEWERLADTFEPESAARRWNEKVAYEMRGRSTAIFHTTKKTN